MKGYAVSPVVSQLGFTGSPILLADFLNVLETIQSLRKTQDIKQRLRYPPVILSCGSCQKDYQRPAFEVMKWIKTGGQGNYCSVECRASGLSVRLRRKCEKCGVSVEGETKYAKLCKGCRTVSRFQKNATADSHRPAVCPMCSNNFQARRRSEGVYATYCSKVCASRGHSAAMYGQANPNWQNGASSHVKDGRTSRAYRHIKLLIRKRDGNACNLCAGGYRLEVHHIDETPSNNASSNLVLLCQPCHNEVHRLLRKEPNSPELQLLKEFAKKPLPTT